jgi:hypothetical protein
MPYFETSAKLNQNVDELINYMMEQVYSKMFSAAANGAGASEGGRDTNTLVLKKNDGKQEGGEKKNSKGGCC